eukprot:13787507-Alexandrium_andersonii.AAC.1
MKQVGPKWNYLVAVPRCAANCFERLVWFMFLVARRGRAGGQGEGVARYCSSVRAYKCAAAAYPHCHFRWVVVVALANMPQARARVIQARAFPRVRPCVPLQTSYSQGCRAGLRFVFSSGCWWHAQSGRVGVLRAFW